MISHHLDDATLMAFAAGDLDEAFSVVVSAHISMCSACREALVKAESVGGVLLQGADVPAEPISDDMFAEMLKLIEANPPSAQIIKIPVASKAKARSVPKSLARYVGDDLDAIKWKTVAPGLRKHKIKLKNSDSSLYLLHIAPGMAMPEHGHGGDELTLILDGAYRDEIGYFGSGDVADLDDHVEHQPRVVSDVPCICLAATQKQTRFKDVIPRLMQPFIGI